MSVQVKTKVEFDVPGTVKKFTTTMDRVHQKTALEGVVMARALFSAQYMAWEPHRHVEHVERSFKAQRSIKKDHGWIFGPFATPGQPWEETVGGRSFFFEYGRMPPGQGRKGFRAAGRGSLYVNVESEGQPPRPYMVPTRDMLRPRFRRVMEREFGKLTKKLNQKYK